MNAPASAPLAYRVARSGHARSDAQREAILAGELGFGRHFTDHMVAIQWDKAKGWHDAQVRAYGPLALDPAAAVLHYGQEIFEGMKRIEFAGEGLAYPLASSLVLLAHAKALQEEFVMPWDLEPLYLRKPDAEINWTTRDRS